MTTPITTVQSFDTADPQAIKQMITAFDEGIGGAPEKLLDGILPALTWMRDEDILDLNTHEIVAYTDLERLDSLTDEMIFQEMPNGIREGVRDYMNALPGYNPDKPWDLQNKTVFEAHKVAAAKLVGYLTIH